MTWWHMIPGALAMVVLWFIPGWALLRGLGLRQGLAAGAGPSVTAAIAGVLGLLYAPLGISWSLGSFGVGVLVCTALATAVGRLLRARRRTKPADDGAAAARGSSPVTARGHSQTPAQGSPWPPARGHSQTPAQGSLRVSTRGSSRVPTRQRWTPGSVAMLGVTWLVGGGVLAGALMTAMGSPDQPAQTWDAVYQLNQLWYVRETGVASVLAAAAPMYGGNVTYYPTVWHSIAGVTPLLPTIATIGNVAILVLGCVVWIAGLLTLTRAVAPQRLAPAIAVPVLAASFIALPTVAFSVLGVWPFAASVACLPGALAILVEAVRKPRPLRPALVYLLASLTALGGIVLLHGSGVFSAAVLAGPMLLMAAVRWMMVRWRDGRRGQALALGLGAPLLGLAVLGTLLRMPAMQQTIAFERGGSEDYLPGMRSLILDRPLVWAFDIETVNVAGALLMVLGAVLSLRARRGRWLVVALVALVILTLLATGPPENPLRVLAGVWFTQPARLHQLLLIPGITLGAVGMGWLAQHLTQRLVRVRWVSLALILGVLVAATGGLRWPTHIQVAATVYSSWPILYGTQLEPEEIGLVDRAGDLLPEGSVVLGDPTNGSAFLPHRAGVKVVNPQLTPVPDSPERDVLAHHFDQWRTDPRVCEAVRELGVTHVYVDALTPEEGGKANEETPALRDLRPQEGDGFDLVDRGGQASLWRFTGCTDR